MSSTIQELLVKIEEMELKDDTDNPLYEELCEEYMALAMDEITSSLEIGEANN